MNEDDKALSYGVEVGIDVPGQWRVCGADMGPYPSLSAAIHAAEAVRGRRLSRVLRRKDACTMDAEKRDEQRRIVGATVYAYNDAEGTIWSHDLIEWEVKA